MHRPLIGFSLALAILLQLNACADPAAPTNKVSAPAGPSLANITVNGPEDIPLPPGEVLPAEFLVAPVIKSTRLEVDFIDDIGYALAQMQYVANNARIDLYLMLKRDGVLLDSVTAVVVDETILPLFRTLLARASLAVLGPCGHVIEARAQYTNWMSFPVPKSLQLFSWGRQQHTDISHSAQPKCPPPPPPADDDDLLDDSGDGYEGTCEVCQQWFSIINGSFAGMWWECNDLDPEFCQSGSSNG